MRQHPDLPLLIIISVVFFLAVDAPAQNNICQGVTPFFTVLPGTTAPSYAFCYPGVPDLDQTRNIGGNVLPGSGEMYCAPTSAVDWMVNLYNEGITNVIPPPPNGNQYDYNYDTNLIDQMGSAAYMQTDPVNGTYGGPFQSGVINWLNTYLPSVPYNVNFIQGSSASAPPLLSDMANAVVNNSGGGLTDISAVIGWYCSNKDPNNPGAVYRCGGHVVPLTAAWRNLHVLPHGFVGINDPDWPGVVGPPQSAFTTNVYSTSEAQLSVASCPSGGPCPGTATVTQTMTQLVGYSGGNAYFDGALEMVPSFVLSYDGSQLLGAWAPKGLEIRHKACLECLVRDLAIHSLGRDADYLVDHSDSIYRWDPISKQVKEIATVLGAHRLAAGGYDDDLYVDALHVVVRLNRRGELVARSELRQSDAIAFDEFTQTLVSLSRATQTVTRFSIDFHKRADVKLEADVCEGSPADAPVRLSVSETSGEIWVRCDGSSTAARVAGGRILRVRLADTEGATGLFVNGQGHILVSVDQHLVEFDGSGKRVKSSYLSGLSTGRDFQLSRSVSNVDPKLLTGPAYYNITPAQNIDRILKPLRPERVAEGQKQAPSSKQN